MDICEVLFRLGPIDVHLRASYLFRSMMSPSSIDNDTYSVGFTLYRIKHFDQMQAGARKMMANFCKIFLWAKVKAIDR